MKLGVLLSGEGLPLEQLLAYGTSLEDAGFDSVWCLENQREPFVPLAALAGRTERVRLGTAIALWARSPVVSAMTAANLDELANGRFVYGLGAGSAFTNEAYHGIDYTRPVERMREYVDVVRAVWRAHSGATVRYEGKRFTLEGFARSIPQPREQIPLYLAAVQERMLNLAGQVADGIIFNICTTPLYFDEFAFRHVRRGATAAGRSFDQLERAGLVCCAVNTDAGLAREWARRQISWYGPIPYIRRLLKAHGFEREASALRAAADSADEQAAVEAVNDEMVDTLAAAGTADQVRKRLERWDGYLDTAVLYPASHLLSADEVIANHEAIRETFAAA
jgi:probable F420-dependent oxidoreductase